MEHVLKFWGTLPDLAQDIISAAIVLLAVKTSQLAYSYGMIGAGRFNKKLNKRNLQAQWTPLNAIHSESTEVKTLSYVLCLYPAAHNFFKAFIFFAIAYASSTYMPSFTGPAIALSIYFGLIALSYVPDLGGFGNKSESEVLLRDINSKLDEDV